WRATVAAKAAPIVMPSRISAMVSSLAPAEEGTVPTSGARGKPRPTRGVFRRAAPVLVHASRKPAWPGVAKDGLPWPKAGTKARLRASNRRTLLGDAKNAAGRRPGILESLEEALGLRRPECFCAADFAQHR